MGLCGDLHHSVETISDTSDLLRIDCFPPHNISSVTPSKRNIYRHFNIVYTGSKRSIVLEPNLGGQCPGPEGKVMNFVARGPSGAYALTGVSPRSSKLTMKVWTAAGSRKYGKDRRNTMH